MLIRKKHGLGVIVCLIVLILSSCKNSQPTPPTEVSVTSDIISKTAELNQTATKATMDAYPMPDEDGFETPSSKTATATISGGVSTEIADISSPYPPPATSQIISSPTAVGAYPYPPPQPTILMPYPGPVVLSATPSPTIISPISTQTQAVATPTMSVDPDITATTQSFELTPSAVPTRIIIRTEIIATDPNTFKVISGRAQLVEFFAFWSPLSRSMAPVVHLLEDQYGDRVNFIYLDIDDPLNSMYKGLMGEQLPPVFFLLNSQGVVQKEWTGYVPAIDLENAILQAAP